jgi:non-specific serine/threonine protein kinase
MPAGEILVRLSDRFRVLGATRTAADRHRTLRAAVSWGYELCSPAEQRLWAALSVFPGSFRLAAAEHVCGPGTSETLARLVRKSVVRSSTGGTTSRAPCATVGALPRTADTGSVAEDRYHLPGAMREFGAERLDAAETGRLRSRHRDYYLGLAERAAAGIMTAGQPAWLAKLGVETANLRVALDYCFTVPGEAPAGLRFTRLLLPYWLMTGQFTEGRRWHELAMPAADGPSDAAWASFGAGVLAVQQGDFASGGPLLARAAGLAGANGDEDLAAHVTSARGMLAFYADDLVTAQAEFEAALALYGQAGLADPTALVTYSGLASVCLLILELDRAVKLTEECLRRCDELGEQWARGTALWTRAAARWLSGDNAAAIEDVLACLRIKERLTGLHTIAMSFDLLSVCLADTGDFERAAVLHGAGESLWRLLNAPVLMGPACAKIRESGAGAARSFLGGERFDVLAGHGCALSLSAALAVAKGEAPAAPAGVGAAPGTGAKPLTRREKEIASLAADGPGNREIAERLFLSRRTVDSHLEHIFTKLGFSSRTELASWVLENGTPP